MREFEIHKNPNDCGILYYRNKVIFKPGVTVLVGCNGCGKTSLIRQIKNRLKQEEIPCLSYDNLHDGGANARTKAGFFGDMEFLATSLCSSEGENIVMNMGNIAREMGAMNRRYPEAKEFWFLFDAVDSGLSIDNVIDLKEYLFKIVQERNKDKDIYIIISANAYEMCRGENCFDTYLCKYIDINSYDEYRKFILKSRERKDKREDAQSKRRKRKDD